MRDTHDLLYTHILGTQLKFLSSKLKCGSASHSPSRSLAVPGRCQRHPGNREAESCAKFGVEPLT